MRRLTIIHAHLTHLVEVGPDMLVGLDGDIDRILILDGFIVEQFLPESICSITAAIQRPAGRRCAMIRKERISIGIHKIIVFCGNYTVFDPFWIIIASIQALIILALIQLIRRTEAVAAKNAVVLAFQHIPLLPVHNIAYSL